MENCLEQDLRAAGARVTPQRRLIASILQKQDRHLNAEEILTLARRQHPRLSQATVYRTLRRLKELGLVHELRLDGDRCHYEIAGAETHHHLVCLGCGKVVEFTCSHCKQVHGHLAEQYNFEITGERVKLLGYCADCQARRHNHKTKETD